jgi:hypothetical protein
MAFKRATAPIVVPTQAELTAAMVGVGMGFAATSAKQPNIEDTLCFASVESMDADDLRVLAILVTWFGVHSTWVNADRLTKLVAQNGAKRVQALWAALAQWRSTDRRFARLAEGHIGKRMELLGTGSDFQIRRHGEDPRFVGTCLRVPKNVLRDRAADVLTPRDLAKKHNAYRYRAMIGPTYRADLWAALVEAPRLSSAELARATYASFASAWQVKRDFEIVASKRA